ncbi:hypothetical protein [Actibacterium sp. XHP0104]|uniref:hypothetical protein n=1 Tax=Actibacterium sp. XHP0104 TaxID=2984335 RepID=UPI0021E84F0D|nr:hypothetical protein [Actibacterium sp. XHP0104]MCV2882845.1 hypothetical protein [Actibacterium sp. XHP0104]
MKQLLFLGAAAFCALSLPTQAEQTYSNTGMAKAKVMSTVHGIGDGHMVIQIHSEFTNVTTEDTSNPLNGASGPCFGSVEIIVPNVTGGGHCVYTDTQGDMAVLTWTSTQLTEGGGTAGSWQLTGGSGKYAGATGGGGYATTTDNDAGIQTNQISGDITLR